MEIRSFVHVFVGKRVRGDSTHRTKGGRRPFDAPAFRFGLQVEMLLVFLDDIYITSMPDRVSEAHTTAKPKFGIVVSWCGA